MIDLIDAKTALKKSAQRPIPRSSRLDLDKRDWSPADTQKAFP